MKLKFTQNIYIAGEGKTVYPGDIVKFKDENKAKSFVEAGFAEEVVEEKPSNKTVAKDNKPKNRRASKETGDE